MAGAKPMSSNGEEVPNDVVHREEPRACASDLKRRMYRSRCRVGWWETSAWLLASGGCGGRRTA